MLAWFVQWTAQLNQTNHIAFAVVTVLTMATIGVCIAVAAELILHGISAGKSRAAHHHH
jgi:hypothetical protein